MIVVTLYYDCSVIILILERMLAREDLKLSEIQAGGKTGGLFACPCGQSSQSYLCLPGKPIIYISSL